MDDKQKKIVRISTPEEIEAAKASIPRKLNIPEGYGVLLVQKKDRGLE